jgi:hypothetical protein
VSDHHTLCPEAEGAEDMCACAFIEAVIDEEYEAIEQRGYDRAVAERVDKAIYDTASLATEAMERGVKIGLAMALAAVESLDAGPILRTDAIDAIHSTMVVSA